MRKMLITCALALVAVAPAQANDGGGKGRELRISGPIVRISSTAVAVENVVGDAILTCAVPERWAEKAGAFKVGDRVRMRCVRYRGRRALLVRLERLAERAEEAREAGRRETRGREAGSGGPDRGVGAAVDRGPVLGGAGSRAACPRRSRRSWPDSSWAIRSRSRAQAACSPGSSATSRPRSPRVRKPGCTAWIAALSRASVTVQGEAGSLTCSVPVGLGREGRDPLRGR